MVIILNAGIICAEEIYLNNGDRISGQIIQETENTMIIETQAMGTISIDKNFVMKEEAPKNKILEEKSIQWQRKASVGYSQTGGNTEASQGFK